MDFLAICQLSGYALLKFAICDVPITTEIIANVCTLQEMVGNVRFNL